LLFGMILFLVAGGIFLPLVSLIQGLA